MCEAREVACVEKEKTAAKEVAYVVHTTCADRTTGHTCPYNRIHVWYGLNMMHM
jgi:hypothetical protein